MGEWQPVFKDKMEYRVELVKSVLENRGLSAVLVNNGINPYNMGFYELLVPADHVLRAIKIINDEINFE